MITRFSVLRAEWGVAFLALLALLAVPAGASDSVITSGTDLWQTPGDGSTFTDFALNPIPAGFFCSGSKPFTGKIAFEGVPLVTGPPGVLGVADTAVQRLDHAYFDRRGIAETRIQVRALSLVSVAPIKTTCGRFDVSATLDGEQPITHMRIVRVHEFGGYYLAPVWLNVKLTFTPVGGRSYERLELVHHSRFPPSRDTVWASRPGEGGLQHGGFVLVDTDGDRQADTYLPGTSNFAAGWLFNPNPDKAGGETQFPDKETQHCSGGGGHCHWLLTVPDPDS